MAELHAQLAFFKGRVEEMQRDHKVQRPSLESAIGAKLNRRADSYTFVDDRGWLPTLPRDGRNESAADGRICDRRHTEPAAVSLPLMAGSCRRRCTGSCPSPTRTSTARPRPTR